MNLILFRYPDLLIALGLTFGGLVLTRCIRKNVWIAGLFTGLFGCAAVLLGLYHSCPPEELCLAAGAVLLCALVLLGRGADTP